jgi:cell division protein FtsW (lipid II flippase)
VVAKAPSARRRPARLRTIPGWPSGPKPRRRTEFGLLLYSCGVTVALYVLASLGAKGRIPPHLGPFLGVVLGLTMVAHVANRWLVPEANPVVLPLVALLNGMGYVIIVRWNPPGSVGHYAERQATWTAIGIVAYVATLLVIRFSRDLDRYRYLLLLVAGLLMVAPLIPHLGTGQNGARLWVRVGSAQFQPIELAKILLCIFFASYFAEKKEILSIPTARIGNRLFVDPRPLLPIVVTWGLAMLVIGGENDIGFALLIFTLFVGLLWITTGRWGYLIFGLALFAVGAVLAAHLFPQVHERVSIWLNPWPQASGNGAQLVQSWFAMGTGGLGGTGLGLDQYAGTIPYLTSDMIFAALADEMGLVGAAAVVIAFLLLVGAGLRIAQTARSDFSRLVATGLTMILGFQAFFIMAGVLRLLPLTGITLPFMAYGGSSLVANYILVALLLRISDEGASTAAEQASGIKQPGERQFVQVT